VATVSSYLNFKRNTEEAFNFYKSVFGTEIAGISRFGDMPTSPDYPGPSEEDKNLIVNIQLPILGGHLLMGTDAPESMGFTLTPGNNFHICLHPDTRADSDRLFAALAEGGKRLLRLPRRQIRCPVDGQLLQQGITRPGQPIARRAGQRNESRYPARRISHLQRPAARWNSRQGRYPHPSLRKRERSRNQGFQRAPPFTSADREKCCPTNSGDGRVRRRVRPDYLTGCQPTGRLSRLLSWANATSFPPLAAPSGGTNT
jgi:PhnB protein